MGTTGTGGADTGSSGGPMPGLTGGGATTGSSTGSGSGPTGTDGGPGSSTGGSGATGSSGGGGSTSGGSSTGGGTGTTGGSTGTTGASTGTTGASTGTTGTTTGGSGTGGSTGGVESCEPYTKRPCNGQIFELHQYCLPDGTWGVCYDPSLACELWSYEVVDCPDICRGVAKEFMCLLDEDGIPTFVKVGGDCTC